MENPTNRVLKPGDTVKIQGVVRQVIAVDYVNQRVKLKRIMPVKTGKTPGEIAAQARRERRRLRAGGASS